MRHDRAAPLLGIAGCVAVLAALTYPYLVLGGGASGYYGSGALNPLLAGLLALVTIVVLAAGREGRTDAGFAAGVALVFGLAIAAVLLAWAVTVRVDVAAIDPVHRWLAVASALPIPAGAAWFARSLGLV